MNRLRAYREIEGETGAETAERLGVSPSLISQIERGQRPLTVDLTPLGYRNDRFTLPEMSDPHHRQLSRTRVTSRRRAKELLRLGGELFEEIAPGRLRSETRLETLGPLTDYNAISELTEHVRDMLDLQLDVSIRNLTRAVERAGVCLVPISGMDGIDGISAWVEGKSGPRPVIGLNPSVPGDRFRLTLAHELGHLVLHDGSGEHCEQEANRFASLLLFPDAAFEEVIPPRPQIRDFAAIKADWGVSIAALIYRSHEEGVVDDGRYRSLQIQMSKWRRREPGEFPAAYGQLLGRLVGDCGGSAAVADRTGLSASHIETVVSWQRSGRHLTAVQ